MIPSLSGKRIHLRPVYPNDYSRLVEWSLDIVHLGLWTTDRVILSQEEAVERIGYRLRNKELVRFMVMDNITDGDSAVGTIYAYDHHPEDGYCFFTVYMAPESVGKGHGAEAAILFVEYLFANFSWLYKLYTDVYGYNERSLLLNRKAGFHQEGCFRDHRYYSGQRWDMYRFAFYRRDWEERRNQFFNVQE